MAGAWAQDRADNPDNPHDIIMKQKAILENGRAGILAEILDRSRA